MCMRTNDMNASSINEFLIQIDSHTINVYSKLKSILNKNLTKQKQLSPPLNKILLNALELTVIIAIITLVLGIYFTSGLHSWWVKLVGQIV